MNVHSVLFSVPIVIVNSGSQDNSSSLRIRSIGTRVMVTAVNISNADVALDVCTVYL